VGVGPSTRGASRASAAPAADAARSSTTGSSRPAGGSHHAPPPVGNGWSTSHGANRNPIAVGSTVSVTSAAIPPATALSSNQPAARRRAGQLSAVAGSGSGTVAPRRARAAVLTHAARRWSGVVTAVAPTFPPLVPLLRVITAGGCVMAVFSALLHLVVGLSAGSALALGVETVNAALALAGAAGVVALVRARPTARWAVAVAAWTGSAAMFSWGLYTVVVRMTTTAPAAADAPAAGTAQLTGLLGGFALAVAGMLALVGSGERRRG
jgi:hypothetical protein